MQKEALFSISMTVLKINTWYNQCGHLIREKEEIMEQTVDKIVIWHKEAGEPLEKDEC